MRNASVIAMCALVGCTRHEPGSPGPGKTTHETPSTPTPSDPVTSVPETTDGTSCELDLTAGPPEPTACWAVTTTGFDVSNRWGAFVTPSIGHLTDDDGDGTFGAGDRSEMVLEPSLSFPAPLTVIDNSGAERLSLDGDYDGNTLILDANGDGASELITFRIDLDPDPGVFYLYVEERDGAGDLLWTSDRLNASDPDDFRPGPPVAGDVDGDGRTDLVVGRWVLDGATGELERQLDLLDNYQDGVLADLDGDGTLEIVKGRQVFGAGTEPEWQADVDDPYAIPIQLDGDPEPELAFYARYGSGLAEYDSDGTPLAAFDVPTSGDRRPPCVADFDGDGEPEIGLPSEGGISVIEVDGTVLWKAAGRVSGCAGADLDLDGAADVVLAGPAGVEVLDGPTGAVRGSWSGAYAEWTPAIVDWDGDGDAEIVVPSSDLTEPAPNAEIVFDGAGWPGVGGQWSMNDFSDERLSASGATGGTSGRWLRARPTTDLGAPPPVTVELIDACSDACDAAHARVSARLYNRGGRAVTAAIEVVGVDADGVEEVVGTKEVTLDGWTNESVPVDVDGDARWARFYARVAGSGSSCTSSGRTIDSPCNHR